jgi:hypothetical protein
VPPNECPDNRKSEVGEFVNANRTESGISYEHMSENNWQYVRRSRAGETPTLDYDEQGLSRVVKNLKFLGFPQDLFE